MHKILKKLFLIIVLIIVTIALTSCSKNPGGISGYQFIFHEKFSFNEQEYGVYVLYEESISLDDQCFSYYYKTYDNINVTTRIINYPYKYEYMIIDAYEIPEEVLSLFRESIKDILIKFEKKLSINFELYDNNTELRKEFVFEDYNKYQTILIIDMYIPFRIQTNTQGFYIYVPVKTFMGLANNNQLELVYEHNNILSVNYTSFINGENVHIK